MWFLVLAGISLRENRINQRPPQRGYICSERRRHQRRRSSGHTGQKPKV